MLFVKTEDLKPGMRLAKPIYNRNGVMLYERNSKITSQGIISVNNFGLIGIYILEPAEPVPPMSEDDIEFERFQAMSIFEIKEILDAYSEGKKENNMYQFINQLLKKYGSLHHKINFIQNIRSNDDYVYKHSLNTAILCALISSRLGLEFKTQLDLTAAALLHDIGKIGIPDRILNKPDRLTDEEYALMKSHVEKGAQILKNFTLINHVEEGALYHHERYDGSGYMYGLKGEEIPLNARIIGIADAFDAMTANRVYRKKLDKDYVIREIKRGSGTQFDPKLVEIMLGLIEKGLIDMDNLYKDGEADEDK